MFDYDKFGLDLIQSRWRQPRFGSPVISRTTLMATAMEEPVFLGLIYLTRYSNALTPDLRARYWGQVVHLLRECVDHETFLRSLDEGGMATIPAQASSAWEDLCVHTFHSRLNEWRREYAGLFIAISGDQVVGSSRNLETLLLLFRTPGTPHVRTFYVAPEEDERGMGDLIFDGQVIL